MNKKKFWAITLSIFVVASVIMLIAFKQDMRPADGPLTRGWPLTYYTVTSGFGSPVESTFNTLGFLGNLGFYFVGALIVGFLIAKGTK